MTTFTLQDLTPEQQTAVNNHEEMHKMFNEIGTALTQPPVMPDTPINAQHAPEPQPTLGEVLPKPDINTIINTICAQLQLLSTVINQQPNTTPPEGNSNTTLQETVALTLQQADWFKDLVRETIVDEVSLEDVVKDIVKEEVNGSVEAEVENYFDYRFSVTDHFDFDDAVSDAVDDRLDDVVRDRVMDSLEEVVAEKLSNANVSISF
jgi:hypothetical protein